jgi:hypothetical protein
MKEFEQDKDFTFYKESITEREVKKRLIGLFQLPVPTRVAARTQGNEWALIRSAVLVTLGMYTHFTIPFLSVCLSSVTGSNRSEWHLVRNRL